MHRKWIPLWRKSQDSAVFKNDHLWKLWTWCLMRMAFEPTTVPMKTGRGETLVDLQPGQLVVGRKAGAEAMGWTGSNFRNRLNRLKLMLKITIQPDTHWSIITIVNWDIYRVGEKEKDSKEDRQVDTQRTGKGQASGHKEEVRPENLKKEPKTFVRPTLEQVTEYCQERGKGVDPQQWMDYYTSNGFKIGGRGAMKDWKAAVRTWERNRINAKPKAKGQTAFDNIQDKLGAAYEQAADGATTIESTTVSGTGAQDQVVVRQLEPYRSDDT